MNIPQLVEAMLADLVLVASSQPNERLPKEEQIRCSIYAAIRPSYRVVCAERGYASIDDGSRIVRKLKGPRPYRLQPKPKTLVPAQKTWKKFDPCPVAPMIPQRGH
jgi:hypothetical protein